MDYASGQRMVPLASIPQARITATSIFHPVTRQCCRCNSFASADSKDSCSCSHTPCTKCQDFDIRGAKTYLGHKIPTHWLCGTCGTTHSVLELLVDAEIECDCDSPTLRTVYDNWGYLLLWWSRPQNGEEDLRRLSNIQEAARKLRLVGGEAWADEIQKTATERNRMEAAEKENLASMTRGRDEMIKSKTMFGRYNRAWSAISDTSMSSEDSFDRELVEMGMMET